MANHIRTDIITSIKKIFQNLGIFKTISVNLHHSKTPIIYGFSNSNGARAITQVHQGDVSVTV